MKRSVFHRIGRLFGVPGSAKVDDIPERPVPVSTMFDLDTGMRLHGR